MPKIVKALNATYRESVLIPSALPFKELTPEVEEEEEGEFIPADDSSPPPIEGAIEKTLEDARAEAEQLVLQARAEAEARQEQLLAEANRMAEAIKAEARKEGFAQGLKEANTSLQAKLDEVTRLLDRIDDKQREIIDASEEGIKLLVVDVVRKIIGSEFKENEKALAGVVKKALANYKNTDWVKLTVSETDAQTSLITDKKWLAEFLEVSGSIEIEELTDAASGLCVVETPDGIADASVATQVENLKQILTGKIT